jgi:hypothetical protein
MVKIRKLSVLMAVLAIVSCTDEYVYEMPPEGMACAPQDAQEEVLYAIGSTKDGRKICVNNRKCTGEPILPPQPCMQPMPQYYGDISEQQIEEGVLLIHPYTRTKVLCIDMNGQSAVQCAADFQAEGYVLITDIPQFAAKYDLLQTGTYPTRKWRNGENVPRW